MQPCIRQMAELFPVQQLKDDAGEAGIPALTVEIGSPRQFDPAKIALAVEGTLNLCKHYGMVAGPLGRTGATVATYQGNAFETLRSRTGGFLDLRVDLQSPVSPGQLVACQRNAFGDVVAEYRASVSGQVATIARDALSEPGPGLCRFFTSGGSPLKGTAAAVRSS